jgi:hypothetical protein
MTVVLLAAVVVLSVSVVTRADDGVFMGAGGAVVPSSSEHVRMAAEEVVLDLTEPGVVHGTCLFVITNDGPADTLLVGFPDNSPDPDDDRPAIAGPSTLYDLEIAVDGVPVATTEVPVQDLISSGFGEGVSRRAYNRAHVWPCVFASGETRVLRTEYRHKLSAMSNATYIAHYILETGATWAGPIGKVVVRVRPGSMRQKEPSRHFEWFWTGTEYVWEASDLEPTENILLCLDDPLERARWLAGIWRDNESRRPAGSQRTPEEFAAAHLHFLGSGDFFQAVCAALGDSLPELRDTVRSVREEILAVRERSSASNRSRR